MTLSTSFEDTNTKRLYEKIANISFDLHTIDIDPSNQ